MKKLTQTLDTTEHGDGADSAAFRQNYVTALKAKGCEVTILKLYDDSAQPVEESNDAVRPISSKR
jgi:hypothetical protein